MKYRIRNYNNALETDKILNYPHKNYPIIHVAGTDGKGSTTNMLASILQEAGYKIGLFNTPGVPSVSNMIKVNGQSISPKNYNTLRNYIKQKNPNIDETSIWVFIALLYFKQKKVDIAILEATIGAKTCPTNIVTPIISLLTNITKDHLKDFDNNLIEYAKEKIGLIKPNVPILVGEMPSDPDVKNMIIDKAQECNSVLKFTDEPIYNFILEHKDNGEYITSLGKVQMCLGGNYQRNNLNLVLNTVQELRSQGFNISDKHIISGLANIYENTGFCGRWQTLQKSPLVILDGCHTVDAWNKVIPQLLQLDYNNLHIIYHACKDKNLNEITRLFPDKENITYWFPDNTHKRLILAEKLIPLTNHLTKSKRYVMSSLQQTLDYLLPKLGDKDIIFIGGTLMIVSPANKYFQNLQN